ncbi:sodium/bile acid cotransporter 7 isoform X2 [Fopius arisanus]|uniref:Slc10a7_0 protein n=1 Tax=Fopius arisanus TaxID=64838 RepID=A0A0C9R0S6_9HYME|nr:PREDICTED: sodium/bile acid cotransporter 7-like isoform X2 [Fopius arisanus]
MPVENQKKFKHRNGRELWNRYGYFVLMLLCMFLASIQPNMGSANEYINGHILVWYIAVPLTYLEAGLICSPRSLYSAARNGYLLCFILAFIYVLMPLLARVGSCLLVFANVNTWLLKGMEVFYCMPPPLSVSLVLTRLSDADMSTSVVTTLVSHFVGILVSPLLLYLMLGASTSLLVGVNLQEIACSTLVPFGVGLTFQMAFNNLHEKFRTSWFPQVLLLVSAYHWFSEAVTADSSALQAVDILLCVLIACLGQILITGICWSLCSRWLSKAILMASLYTIMHKSVGLGGWILRGAYHGSAHGAAVNLPLAILPVAQLLLGSLLACWMAP